MSKTTKISVRPVQNGQALHQSDLIAADCSLSLRDRIENRTASIGIIGLGYVGLPLARTFASNGFPVLGFDIDPSKVACLMRGQTYLRHIPSEAVAEMCNRQF